MRLKPHNKIMHRYSKTIKNEVRKMRSQGLSLDQIYDRAHIPKTTIRGWISDIKLTSKQQEKLKSRMMKALQKGRVKAEKKQKQQRVKLEKELLSKGKEDVNRLTKRELFIAGIALYWAEGFKNKHEKRLGFCNSDPNMILFYLKWLQDTLKITSSNITARLTLNISYKDREFEIKKYWSKLTGISLNQFTKTFYQNTLWKKEYNNENYYGVLRIHVNESLKELLTMRGWIEGLKSSIYP